MTESPRVRDLILIVDDSPETLMMLTEILEQIGATVLVATHGAQALSVAERITPDIILLDAVMPELDGFETCRRLKRSPLLAHVPVIFMTGLSETEHVVRGLEAGGVDYITKPIRPDELHARMRVHLTNARAARSAHLALDTTGRFLLASDARGRVLWCTPHAQKLIEGRLPRSGDQMILPEALHRSSNTPLLRNAEVNVVLTDSEGQRLHLSFVGQVGSEEYLFRLTIDDSEAQAVVLKQSYALTSREAEVLVWLARGKSNRDIAEILGLSPRTVNKHLEQVFAKLGVENRASAAASALRALGA